MTKITVGLCTLGGLVDWCFLAAVSQTLLEGRLILIRVPSHINLDQDETWAGKQVSELLVKWRRKKSAESGDGIKQWWMTSMLKV